MQSLSGQAGRGRKRRQAGWPVGSMAAATADKATPERLAGDFLSSRLDQNRSFS